MEIDNELIEMFTDELNQLKVELTPIVESLQTNPQQPEQFINFAQIIDRIYGTATTMGLEEIGAYTGAVRNMTRKTGTSKVPRAMTEVLKLVKNCMENLDQMQTGIQSPDQAKILNAKMKLEITRCTKIDETIFAFSKDATAVLTK